MLAFGWASAQSAAPAGYPTVVRPNSPNVETVGYEELKQEWINSNSAQYEALINGKLIAVEPASSEMTEAEKNNWASENPQLQAPAPIAENPTPVSLSQQKVKVSQTEFDALPAARQQSVLNDSRFIIYQD